MVKIPSGEITNLPYLRKAARLFRQVILSTGMTTISEIKDAVSVFIEAGIPKKNITILHCNTEYPTPMDDVNLKAMLHIQEVFGTEVGYSDHTLGIEVPIAAVALGASVIEKHFTLDRTLPGPDHRASLVPDELAELVLSVRQVEAALGSSLKAPSPSERENRLIVRKSLVAKRPIRKGERFTADNVTCKRPGGGVSPIAYWVILERTADRDYDEDEALE